ncbi:MAG: hypothetical protein WBL93_02190 [Lutisporaceae bacterium]
MKKLLVIIISISIIICAVFISNYIREYNSYTIIKENYTKALSREDVLNTTIEIILKYDTFSFDGLIEDYYLSEGKLIISDENISDLKTINNIHEKVKIASKEEMDSLRDGFSYLRVMDLLVSKNSAQVTVENIVTGDHEGIGGRVTISIHKRVNSLYYKIIDRGIY